MAARFISFEGIDGSGKSTQLRLLADHLRAKGHSVLATREPGGADGAEAIRKLLLEGETGRWSAKTEILLFTAARRDHLERTIQPALARGDIVLCDRFADSTRVYQGAANPELREMVDRLHELMIGVDPELTLILDLDPLEALSRTQARGLGGDRFEGRGLDFQHRLRDGFQSLAGEFPERCEIIPASDPGPDIARKIRDTVEKRL
ncbi:dTMP kinase [Amaricoccus macauensis]|uniref:dTMP kinase n=1 Tax=Amaricoccus macauensis TaxID=57001 RepID=UPI003C7E9E26